ncbi:arylsulfatase B [Orussus abietinus]|uniref:arylsulfatase B n=1 Tax=Orussus abietinus TaxID=222816 RepID=UPI000C715BBA|nr:arylsulfatase B [Orussus abietinus]
MRIIGSFSIIWAFAVLYVCGISVHRKNGHFEKTSSKQPHIVVIIADDLGWNDVGFHGSNQIPTPNIDALAYYGVILNRHYVLPTCTPSRTAFLTGRYPIRAGMQGYPLKAGEPRGIPLDTVLLPEHLRRMGYSTHLVGKWHVGYFSENYTPARRGFDDFRGYYNGYIQYFNYTITQQNRTGYDFHRDTATTLAADYTYGRTYLTDAISEEAESIIASHDPSKPLYLQISHGAPHSSDNDDTLEVRDMASVNATLGYVESIDRRNFIKLKFTLYEGGIRGASCIYSPLIKDRSRISNQLVHITDWLPTFYSAAGGDLADLGPIDGVDQWSALSNYKETPRESILLNIDEVANLEGALAGRFKLVKGAVDLYGDYYGDSGSEPSNPKYNAENVLKSLAGFAISSQSKYTLSVSKIIELKEKARVVCEDRTAPANCSKYCLFDVIKDPCETADVSLEYPHIVEVLNSFIDQYRPELMPQTNADVDPASFPGHFNGVWMPWVKSAGQSTFLRSIHTPLQSVFLAAYTKLIARY